MPNATVRVDKKYQPKDANARTGSIQGPDGSFYRIPRKMLPALEENETYEFQYRDWEDPSGNTHHIVDTFKKVENGKAPAPAIVSGVASRECHIFVCGIMNNTLHGAGLDVIQEGAITQAINTLIRAYNRSHLVQPYTPAEKDMDDEIPYHL